MKLTYHKGNNFGDELNPFIFERYLLDFLDNSENELLLGIGTILGLKKSSNKKIVFSSGATDSMLSTYGAVPSIDNTYDIFCVRGPLTARLLNLDPSLAVLDGAYLLYDFYKKPITKKYKVSYIPHVGSESFYEGLQSVFEDMGINYISPKEGIDSVLEKINQSELVLAEAMHGAIVADALRVNWIPIKMYKTINEFKWKDWLFSINKEYEPFELPSLFDFKIFNKIISDKIHTPEIVNKIVFNLFQTINKSVLKIKLKNIIGTEGNLSDEKLIIDKVNILKIKLDELKDKYSK